ncbi:hypothetical protein HDU84_007014 [Entophlyctis sp. JEL0112]|nr:hypothetical protein HDU84_007014 [Entophlyctis sp. JEL0112]
MPKVELHVGFSVASGVAGAHLQASEADDACMCVCSSCAHTGQHLEVVHSSDGLFRVVRELEGEQSISSACSSDLLCAIKGTNLVAWAVTDLSGEPYVQALPSIFKFPAQKICAGYAHFLALDSGGVAYAWGSSVLGGLHGQLGNGSMTTPTTATGDASPFTHPPAPIAALLGLRVTDIGCAGNYSIAVVDGCIVYSFGANSQGQLANAPHDRATPTPVPFDFDDDDSAGSRHLRVACGPHHAVAAFGPGAVWAWGDDAWGAVSGAPVDDSNILEIAAVSPHGTSCDKIVRTPVRVDLRPLLARAFAAESGGDPAPEAFDELSALDIQCGLFETRYSWLKHDVPQKEDASVRLAQE